MDDGRYLPRENDSHQQQCRYEHSASNVTTSSLRDNNPYYDPIHESGEWQLNNSRVPDYLAQITSTWTTPPSLITYQGPSDFGYQAIYNPLNPSPEIAGPLPSTGTPADGLRHTSNNYNTPQYMYTLYDYERTNETELPSMYSHRNLEGTDINNTFSDFMSPMFLSNPELASIDTRRTQINTTTTDRNVAIPPRPPTQPFPRTMPMPPREQSPTIIVPSGVEPVSLQNSSRFRRRQRQRNQHNVPEVPNTLVPSNENIFRREYGVAFSSSGSSGGSPASAIREAVLRRAMFEKRTPSKSVLASLEVVKLEELDKNDCSCIICYNEFGVANPEGIVEFPLRLPKCKHVFGDKCIKKWFEDSDSCPYCRDKLPSESPLQKAYGMEAPSQSRERLVTLRRRILHAQNLSRYISTVELTHSRIAQTMQTSNIPESNRDDLFRGAGSVLTSDDLPNLSINRTSAIDFERRRCLQSRGINPRSAHHLSRALNGRSARSIRSNIPVSSDTGIFLLE